MAETLNMIELSMEEAINAVREELEDDIYTPLFILGRMGMGKTAGLKELAHKMGIGYCELRLVNMTETDMLGIPTITTYGQEKMVGPDGKEYTQDKSRTTYASNNLLPMVERDGEVGILAIDEITSCSDVMRAAAYQLLDAQRSLGNYHLPPKWKCVGLGNGPDDGGVFNGGESALWTRGGCIRVTPNVEAWKDYAIPAGVNPTIVAYLTMNPDKLHVYDPDEMDGATACPRSWENLSIKLNKRESRNNGRPLPREAVSTYASMYVGRLVGSTFAGFYQYKASDQLINPRDIVDGKALGKNIRQSDPEVIYITIQNVIGVLRDETSKDDYELSDSNKKKLVNTCKWCIDIGRQRTDYGIIACRDIIKSLGSSVKEFIISKEFREMCPEFLKFANEKSNVIS